MSDKEQGKSLDSLTENQLKSKLQAVWEKHEADIRKEMAPLLYHLRDKLKAQGRAGEGFGAWVEEHLCICRRTADRWANQYAVKSGLKTAPEATKTSEVTPQLVTLVWWLGFHAPDGR